jgi:class 3 adenylate cyclase
VRRVTQLPSGTVTFLFSDIEGSTRLMQQLDDEWGEVLAAHNRIMRDAYSADGGREVDRQGDAFFAVFPRARNALAAAATIQRELAATDWPDGIDLRVRMGVHTGEPAVGDEGYLGLDVVRAARICSLAVGGQVLVSETTCALVRGQLGRLSLEDVGEHRLKDIEAPERLFQLTGPGLLDGLPAPAPNALSPADVMAAGDRELELANQALARIRGLDLGSLESLGPRIEQQVQDALARAPVPKSARVARDHTGGRADLEHRRVSPRWLIVLASVIGIALLAGVVALLVWLVTLVL